MLISWTKLLFTLIVNKRKIQNKLKSLFASLILGLTLGQNVPPQMMKLMPLTALQCPNVAMWTHLPLQACNILLWNLWESLWTLKIHSNQQICHHHKYHRQVVITTRKPMNRQWLPAIQNCTYHTTASWLLNKTRPSKRRFCFHLKLSSLNCRNQLFRITTSARQGQSVTSVSLTNKNWRRTKNCNKNGCLTPIS